MKNLYKYFKRSEPWVVILIFLLVSLGISFFNSIVSFYTNDSFSILKIIHFNDGVFSNILKNNILKSIFLTGNFLITTYSSIFSILFYLLLTSIYYIFLSIFSKNKISYDKTIVSVFTVLIFSSLLRIIPILGSVLFSIFYFIMLIIEISKENRISKFVSFIIIISPFICFILMIFSVIFSFKFFTLF
jgi:hypothetical protein